MDVVWPDRRQAGPLERPEYFSGTARLQYLRRPEAGGAELIAVFFDPGARTIPHIAAGPTDWSVKRRDWDNY